MAKIHIIDKILFKILLAIAYVLSRNSKLQDFLVKLIFLSRQRRIWLAIETLCSVMPKVHMDTKIDCVKSMIKNFTQDISESFFVHTHNHKDFLEVYFFGIDNVKKLLDADKNVILFTGHFTKFETSGACLAKELGKDRMAVFYKKYKLNAMNKIIPKMRGFKHYFTSQRNMLQFQKDLKKSARATFIFFDQYHQKGREFDFLGHTSCFSTVFQKIAIKEKAHVYYMESDVTKDKLSINLIPVYNPEQHKDMNEIDITNILLQNLEQTVKKDPSRWLMLMHNLFKHNKIKN